MQNPLSSGSTEKITVDIFSSENITQEEVSRGYKNIKHDWLKPMEDTYKYISKDITDAIDKNFKAGLWIHHKIYLKDLRIHFSGVSVKIFTSYKIDLSVDYEQSPYPMAKAVKGKGLLKGTIEADINLAGEIFINEKAQLQIKPLEDKTKITFTKILFPKLIELLKETSIEETLTRKILEEPINRYVFAQIQEQISKKQVDIKLAERIQKLVHENSYPSSLSKDLWLVPQAKKISISQVYGEGGVCSNSLSINVGVIANPQLVTSSSRPLIKPLESLPIVCETLNPKIYLYPSINIPYDFIEKTLERELQSFMAKERPDSDYSFGNVDIYPSNSKLVIAIDLIEKDNKEKVTTFYLWGTPSLNTQAMFVSLNDLEYTLESKNYLLKAASWILEERIKVFIQKKAFFNYKEELSKLSTKLSSIEHTPGKKILTGSIHSIKVENIFTSKDALILHTRAKGNLSYKVKLYSDKETQ